MRKHWWFKHWRLDDFSPNSPMLEPSKVSLHTVYTQLYILRNMIFNYSIHQVDQVFLCSYYHKITY